jgi:hypothetical protein
LQRSVSDANRSVIYEFAMETLGRMFPLALRPTSNCRAR